MRPERRQVEPLELLQRREHGDPARRGRPHPADAVAAIGAADRRPRLRVVGGDVAGGHLRRIVRRAVDRGGDRLRVRADVETVRAARGDAARGSAANAGFFTDRADRLARCRRRRRRCARASAENAPVAAILVERIVQPRRDREPVAGEPDRRLEQRRPRQLAVALVRERHHPQIAGHADALAAGLASLEWLIGWPSL